MTFRLWGELELDYDQVAFWGGSDPAPDSFDRERLKTVLAKAGLPGAPIGDEIIEGAAAWLHLMGRSYREPTDYIRYTPSKELRNLDKALSEWLDQDRDAGLDRFLFKDDEMEAVAKLKRKTGHLLKWLESQRPRRKQEDPKTTFFLRVYQLYRVVSEEPGLSDGGPAHHFVTECARLVDPSIVVPQTGFRQLIQAAIGRAQRNGHLQK